MSDDIVKEIEKVFGIVPSGADRENDKDKIRDALRRALEQKVAALAQENMEHLLWLLYRVDVNEHKLKIELQKNAPEHAVSIIADAILERLEQKAETRKKYSDRQNDEEYEW
ncbi:MAG: hypothetical protein RMJ53_10185 [Chitinophagales bacterium]|nr:hypothetical protein [Chitinophagales bacterium]MDW8274585.1 hypothetical protein [Chitinophagales bacterium]